MCLAGSGVKASAVEALKWFELAAEKGNGLGKFRQAQVYQAGAEGVPKDEDRAQFLINAAATEGQADAQHALGLAAEQAGRKADAASERDKHFAEAFGWYEKAVAQNQPQALLAMAKFLDQGLGGAAKDPAKGMEYSFKAAQAGLLSAIMDMGSRYLQGRGIRADNVAALGWFLVAAEGGSSEGMIRLGQAYENGQGVPPNFGKAAAWYASAAKLNSPPGQFLLARLQEEGRGLEKNLVFAYINYLLAADGGMDEAVPRKQAVKAQLTPAQIKEAENLMAPAPKTDAPKKN
jgi:TPR repeat protein